MATRPGNFTPAPRRITEIRSEWHPFGAHGVLLALPLSLAMWALIGKLLF
jgi:hypothetical protein